MSGSPQRADLYESLAGIGKAFSNGKRLEIIELLAQGERSVDALAQVADIPATSVSAHLQVLKHAGVVAARREGTRVRYGLTGDDIVLLYHLLLRVARSHVPRAELLRSAHLGPSSDTASITPEQLFLRLTRRTVTVLDARPEEEYAVGRVPGALSAPLETLRRTAAELPTGAELVVYGRSANCTLAHQAVGVLTSVGRPAAVLSGGLLEWCSARYPMEADDKAQ
ncbi:ArsR/SmtB family transcription factor [Actinosynnema sp. NPDC091369]